MRLLGFLLLALLSAADPLLTIDDLARRLGLTKKAAYNRRHRGDLPRAVRIGSSLRWRPEDVDRWLDAHLDDEGAGGERG